ncbi:MAG: accessory gene regulator B family protein [Parasporobacterium sp.]|nr:accessory gene regulator B family protein [Parasporobacterium sp.]
MKCLSDRLSKELVQEEIVEKNVAEYYSYGFERLYISILMYLIILVTALITGTLIPSIIFTTAFVLQRQFSGGYHCNSSLKCTVLSLLIYFMLLVLVFTKSNTLVHIMFVLSNISAVPLIICAPVVCLNNPLSDIEKHRYKCISRIITFILLLIQTITFVMNCSIICLPLSYSMITDSLLLIIALLKGGKNEKDSIKASR